VKYWNTWIHIDGANRAVVNMLKIAFDEPRDWDPKDVNPDTMKVLPVNFLTDHKNMLSHLMAVVSKGYLGIPADYDKLITSLRTAYAKELDLQKDQTSYNDSLDALRLSLRSYLIE
jgi:hypothetical protein